MQYELVPVSLVQLRELANSMTPATLAFEAEDHSLPPDFVAAESLRQIEDEGCPDWCSTYLILRLSDKKIVGSGCFKRAPSQGSVEIGYGIAATARNRGAATQAVKNFVSLALRNGMVRVTAEASPDNPASTKVLQNAGFMCVGRRVDEKDGPVDLWAATGEALANRFRTNVS